MAVTLDFEVETSLRALRAALTSVVPHSEPTKTQDEVSPLCRVRLVFGRDEVHVMATNSLTSALAAVPIDDGTDTRRERFAPEDAPYVLDVDPGVVRRILQSFKVARPSADAEDAPAGIIIRGDGMFEIEDRDGLIPGMLSRYPHLATSDSFPDVRAALSQAAAQAMASAAARSLIVEPKVMRLFAHAGVAYGRPVRHEPIGSAGTRGWWVWCGPKFMGTLSSDDPAGDTIARAQAERREHFERLGLGPKRDPLDLAAAELGVLDPLEEHFEADDREPAMAGA